MKIQKLKAFMIAEELKTKLNQLRQKHIFYNCWRIKDQIIVTFHDEAQKDFIKNILAQVLSVEPGSLLFEYRKVTSYKSMFKIIIHKHQHLHPGITQIMDAFFKFV